MDSKQTVKPCMLTTFDNPYNPFEDFSSWFMYDIEKGYYSCSKLARIANYSDDMTQREIDIETERAIDSLIANDFTNSFRKITLDSKPIDESELIETAMN